MYRIFQFGGRYMSATYFNSDTIAEKYVRRHLADEPEKIFGIKEFDDMNDEGRTISLWQIENGQVVKWVRTAPQDG